MAAILKAAGDLTAGVQVKGATKNYQLDATSDATANAESITPYDSGTILGTVPPGGTGLKLVSGVQQRSEAALLCDGTINALTSTSGLGVLPTAPTGSTAADGLSLAPQQE